ncbi:MAG: hypothetical protein AAF802_03765 [Planctomycetota bacterium]
MEVRTEFMRYSNVKTAITAMAATLFAMHWIVVGSQAFAQSPTLMEDPNTGDVYEKTTQMQPVVEQKIDRRQETYLRPETVVENRPEVRTVYTPVTQMRWMPYVEGRWNPFRIPTVAYRQVPETRWEARNEVVNRASYRTRMVRENHTVETPRSVVRNVPTTNYRLVATGASRSVAKSNLNPAVENRLRPVSGPIHTNHSVTTVASNSVGRNTSDPPRRSAAASGMRPHVLTPNTYGSPLPPATSTIATVPSFSYRR